MPQIVLNQPGIRALIGQSEAAGMAEHVRMGGQGEPGQLPVVAHGGPDGAAIERRAALADEEGFPRRGHRRPCLQPRLDEPDFVAAQGVRGRKPFLEPGDMQDNPHYHDVTKEVGDFLAERMAQCASVGIPAERIILDPGFGFAKTLQHNLSLFKHMEALHALGRPLLVGVSRKSMIGLALNRPVGERLFGGLALAALASAKGARILRVHDVAETVDVVRMIAAVESAE